jgi:hypothetical protein
VRAAGRQGQRAAGRDAQQPAFGVEQIQQREEVLLVRATPVEENEEPFGLGGGGSPQMGEGVLGHVRGR